MEAWPEPEQRSFRSMALLVAALPDLAGWPESDKHALVAIMRAKGARTEHRYFELLRAHPRFQQALSGWVGVSLTPSER